MEVDVSEYSKTIQQMRSMRVSVKPIYRKGDWVPDNHDSAFLNEGSTRDYTVPNKRRGNALVDPCFDFEAKDRQALANELGIDVNLLNPNHKQTIWKDPGEATVKLDRNGRRLNLKDTKDFLDYLVLRSNSHLISPTWGQRFDSGEYKFALVAENEEIQERVSNLEEKKQAYQYLGKIDHSATQMTDFLYVYYLNKKDAKRPPRNATVDWLKSEIGKIIESDLDMFLEILGDKNYNLKLLIQKATETGALIKDKHLYKIPGSDETIGVLEDLIDYLDDPKHSAERIKLMHHVEGKVEA